MHSSKDVSKDFIQNKTLFLWIKYELSFAQNNNRCLSNESYVKMFNKSNESHSLCSYNSQIYTHRKLSYNWVILCSYDWNKWFIPIEMIWVLFPNAKSFIIKKFTENDMKFLANLWIGLRIGLRLYVNCKHVKHFLRLRGLEVVTNSYENSVFGISFKLQDM